MSSDYAVYHLGPYETLWKDDCSVCPAHIEFQVAAKCGRQSAVDGRCFRGDWAQDNDWFAYHFQFPPEWSSGSVDFVYTFKYWALGSWENEKDNIEDCGSSFCNPSLAYASADDFICPLDMDSFRDKATDCGKKGWNEWTASVGTFSPYALWNASGGDDGSAQTACFKQQTFTHTTVESSITLAFWTWHRPENDFGMSGPRSNEAWVVSDFEIEFSPPEFTTTTTLQPEITTTPMALSSTRVKTTTTVTPTTTNAPSTTKYSPTTTELMQSTTVTHSTLSGVSSTVAPTKMTVASTRQSTAPMTTNDDGDEDSKGKNEGVNWMLLAVIGTVTAVVLLVCIWYYSWFKEAKAQSDAETGHKQVTVTVATEMQRQVLPTPTAHSSAMHAQVQGEEAVVGVKATPGEDLKNALLVVDKVQRHEKDAEEFGKNVGESESYDSENDAKAPEFITAGNISTSESESV